jgi:hypothetical protein
VRRPPLLRCAVLLLVALLAIGHAAGVQLIAWTCMFASRLPTTTVGQALSSTLDGSRPCGLCVVAESLATQEQAAPGTGNAGKQPIKTVKTAKTPDWHLGEALLAPPLMEGDAELVRAAPAAAMEGHERQPPCPPPRTRA